MKPVTFTQHRPVMLREVLTELDLHPGLIVVDGTVGAAGHSSQILPSILPGGRLLGFDRDASMLDRARQRLETSTAEKNSWELFHHSYREMPAVLAEQELSAVDRILVDLGLSSDQLADEERGFGLQTSGLLDMRFDTTAGEPIHVWLNRADVAEITSVLEQYGEEQLAEKISAKIVAERNSHPITQVAQLAHIIHNVYVQQRKVTGKTDPATKSFQALRIQANSELLHLQQFLSEVASASLVTGGILAVITFHSLEDRLVKQALADREVWAFSSKKPIVPSPLEIKMNPRSRSAKLRIGIRAEKKFGHIPPLEKI